MKLWHFNENPTYNLWRWYYRVKLYVQGVLPLDIKIAFFAPLLILRSMGFC
jgi:hypothetical protein